MYSIEGSDMFTHLRLTLAAVAGATLLTATLTAPAKADEQPMSFQVYKVEGKVRASKIGTSQTTSVGWNNLKAGDQITAGMQVFVPLRSSIQLIQVPNDPPTIVMIESTTLASFDELKMRDGKAVTRLSIARGAIRAGVVEEGSAKSDLEIRSPNATLSKRGTWGFRLWVGPAGRWEMSLADRGLVEAIQANSNRRRLIYPGQTVNQRMSQWIQTARFNLPVSVQDLYGIKGTDAQFNMLNNSGFGFLLLGTNTQGIGAKQFTAPTGGTSVLNAIAGQGTTGGGTNQLRLARAIQNRISQNRTTNRVFNNTGGNFGVGFGTVPINTNGAAAKHR